MGDGTGFTYSKYNTLMHFLNVAECYWQNPDLNSIQAGAALHPNPPHPAPPRIDIHQPTLPQPTPPHTLTPPDTLTPPHTLTPTNTLSDIRQGYPSYTRRLLPEDILRARPLLLPLRSNRHTLQLRQERYGPTGKQQQGATGKR